MKRTIVYNVVMTIVYNALAPGSPVNGRQPSSALVSVTLAASACISPDPLSRHRQLLAAFESRLTGQTFVIMVALRRLRKRGSGE